MKSKPKKLSREQVKQLEDFFETGVFPELPPERRAQNALMRCVWLLKAPGVKEALKGYQYDYVIKYSEECLNFGVRNEKRPSVDGKVSVPSASPQA